MGYFHRQDSVADYAEQYASQSCKPLLDLLLAQLPKGSTLLELGMGPGADMVHLKQHFQATGSDFSEPFLNLAEQRFPDLPLIKLDAETLATQQHYAAVYSNRLMRYLSDPQLENCLYRLQAVISPGGVFCHSFELGDQPAYLQNGLHIYPRSAEDISDLVGRFFTVEQSAGFTDPQGFEALAVIALNDRVKSVN